MSTDGGARILVVDDEEIVLDSCSEILRDAGYVVATAADGSAGLGQLEAFRPDVVFVDLKMPGLSGLDVLERLRAHDPSIVAVVITGYATLASAVEAMQRGAYDFVPKPFTPEEFRLITRRALEKRRLVRETIQLRREQEMLREHFARIVAHELKSPLAAVQQNLMLLAAELAAQLTPVQRERLVRLQSRLDGLLKMVDTWLHAISGDLGKLRERFQPTAVPAVITRALEAVQPVAARKDVTIAVLGLEPSLPPVRGDEGTLAEAVTNVLGNAVKYSHPGGRVALSVRLGEDQVLISVADAGVGIAPEDLPYIFGDFYRGSAGTGGEAGAGLGLAVTRRIVEAHGGTITVESTPGQGSTFVITLPVARSEPPLGPAQERTQSVAPLGGAV